MNGETQVIKGTTEEIMTRLREAYPEQTLRVTVEPQEEDLLQGMPPPRRQSATKRTLLSCCSKVSTIPCRQLPKRRGCVYAKKFVADISTLRDYGQPTFKGMRM